MRDFLILFVHLIVIVARLAEPGGLQSTVSQTPGAEQSRSKRLRSRLRRNTQGTLDEPPLSHIIGLPQPTDLSLADDVHCFVPRDGVQRTLD